MAHGGGDTGYGDADTAIYWDGKAAATDKGGGRAGKTSAFSVGESTVFKGRFLHGGVEEAALWNRALKATEVAAIYATAKPVAGAAASPGAAAAAAGGGSGGLTTTATVEMRDLTGKVPLKQPEVIAVMFLGAIQLIEYDCQFSAKRSCPMEELLKGFTARLVRGRRG